MTHPLDRLFRPRSVALVGASADPGKTAGRPLRLLRRHGFAGAVWPVNPRADEIDGLPCFPDVDALPDAPDVAMVLVGPARAMESVRALAARGTGAAIVLAGGYGEVGAAGADRQAALRAAAGAMRLLGPNTIGLVNRVDGVTLSASGALDVGAQPCGRVAVVSQSGGILGSLLSRAAQRGIGLSHLVATGNEADIEVSDVVAYLLDDAATTVIALYLETLRRPERFRAVAAEAAARGKRLVAYKVGRSEAGARSAASHTGALAGEDRLYDALFRQAGVVRVERYTDLLDVPMGLSAGKPLAGARVGILTSTGGAGGLVADVCGLAGFAAPAPGAATIERLGALFQDAGFVPERNPIDLTLAGLDPAVMRGAIDALLASDDYDAVVPIVGSSSVGRPDLVAVPAIEAAAAATKPLLVYVSPAAPDILARLNGAGVPAFDTPEGMASALAALARPAPAAAPEAVPADPPDELLRLSGFLDETEAKQLFAAAGIPAVREVVAPDPATARKAAAGLAGHGGDRVVVKLLSRAVAHKTEIGGVRVGVPADAVAGACTDIAAAAEAAGVSAEGFLVQEQVTGVEIILGFTRDPQLGPAILLGGGGTLAELYEDTALRLLPVGAADVDSMLSQLRVARLLEGWRGGPPADLPALKAAVLAFAGLCARLGDRLVEAEINPLFVLPEGQGVRAADGVALLKR